MVVLPIETDNYMTQDAFRNSVFVLRDEMFRFAKRLVSSADEAEDVVQELMLKFWQKKELLLDCENIKAFAMKSVRNECLNRLKHEEVKSGFASVQIYQNETYRPEINNLKDEILKYINGLPEKQKAVMHLKDVEEYDVAEICTILEMEESAVRVNLMRARQKVKEQITNLMNFENRKIQNL